MKSASICEEDRKLTLIEKLVLPSGGLTGTFQFK
jgi:hypothetical protein